MARGYELFDHTADVGLRVTADSLPELVRAAGEGLYGVIGVLEPTGEEREVRIELRGDDSLALLLRDYLTELLVRFETQHQLVTDVQVTTFDAHRLHVTVQTAAVDPDRSIYYREVKAVTYHELALRRTRDGYEAIFILDI